MDELSSFPASRQAAGFSLEDVSREFRVPTETVHAWETEEAHPPQYVMRSLDLIHSLSGPSGEPEDLSKSIHTEDPVPHKTVAPERPVTAKRPPTDTPSESPRPRKQGKGAPDSLIRSKKRVADHGEVFTPSWLVEKMLDLVKGETERIDSRFLEPACGSGNFLVPILQRKLAAVEVKIRQVRFRETPSCLAGAVLLLRYRASGRQHRRMPRQHAGGLFRLSET